MINNPINPIQANLAHLDQIITNETDLNENQPNDLSFVNPITDNRKKCKCGASDHAKTNHMACPLNKKYTSNNTTS